MNNHEISDFQADVIERSRSTPVLVDFWAEWCAPCRALGPILERLEEKQKGRWALAKVNTDVHQETAHRYGIRSIPNVKLFIDGEVVDEFTGALPERAVEQWLAKAIPGRFKKELDAASVMIDARNGSAARSVLESIVREDPANEYARVLLARVLVFDEPARALDLAGSFEEHSDHFQLAGAVVTIARLLSKDFHPESLPEGPSKATYMAALQKLAGKDFDSAVEKFIEVVRDDRKLDDDGARRAVVSIFRILGDTSPIVQKYRRSFSGALYS
jgi:putative thioredoxin